MKYLSHQSNFLDEIFLFIHSFVQGKYLVFHFFFVCVYLYLCCSILQFVSFYQNLLFVQLLFFDGIRSQLHKKKIKLKWNDNNKKKIDMKGFWIFVNELDEIWFTWSDRCKGNNIVCLPDVLMMERWFGFVNFFFFLMNISIIQWK